uniref:Uncharacterized protein n=1 Tax=Lepeophtheirus salmonis TaxID=72036 RepID=A0A0K2VAE8_LEPSM
MLVWSSRICNTRFQLSFTSNIFC